MKTYHFVALKQNSTDIDHILTASIVVGYIYCNIAYMIPVTFSYLIDNLLIILSSIITAYVLAKIVMSKNITPILDKLGILDTGNVYMWDDLMDKNYPMKMRIVYNNMTYEGITHNIESYTNSPHIAMCSYKIYNKKGKKVYDYSTDNTRVIIIHTEMAEKIEIIYDKNSLECKDIQSLCDYNKNIET